MHTDFSLLERSTGGDLPFMKKMILLVITETEKKAGEIQQLLGTPDEQTICRIAHSMKPSIDHVAVQSIRDLVRSVEAGHDNTETFHNTVHSLLNQLSQLVNELKEHELIREA